MESGPGQLEPQNALFFPLETFCFPLEEFGFSWGNLGFYYETRGFPSKAWFSFRETLILLRKAAGFLVKPWFSLGVGGAGETILSVVCGLANLFFPMKRLYNSPLETLCFPLEKLGFPSGNIGIH